jgi:hypothetical protein
MSRSTEDGIAGQCLTARKKDPHARGMVLW